MDSEGLKEKENKYFISAWRKNYSEMHVDSLSHTERKVSEARTSCMCVNDNMSHDISQVLLFDIMIACTSSSLSPHTSDFLYFSEECRENFLFHQAQAIRSIVTLQSLSAETGHLTTKTLL